MEMFASSTTYPWHNNFFIQEQVDYMGYSPQYSYNPNFISYDNTYNMGCRNHLNFPWGNQENAQSIFSINQSLNLTPSLNLTSSLNFDSPGFPPQQQKLSLLEEIFANYVATNESNIQNLTGSIKNLENLVGKLAKIVSDQQQGALTGSAEPNPREGANAITLDSGKELVSKDDEPMVPISNPPPHVLSFPPPSSSPPPPLLFSKLPATHAPNMNIPYPSKLRNKCAEKTYKSFLDILKQIHINIPFCEAISHTPKYAKYLKELLYDKERLEDISHISFDAECQCFYNKEHFQNKFYSLPSNNDFKLAEFFWLDEVSRSTPTEPLHLEKSKIKTSYDEPSTLETK